MLPPITPEKWQKYEMLEAFGLAPSGYAGTAIHRYAWRDRSRLLRDLEDETRRDRGGAFWVVKFVPQRLSYLLPNHRIYGMQDLAPLRLALETENSRFAEVWLCKTDVAPDLFSVAGRILIDRREGIAAQTIEQVWRCSPRLIEKFDHDFPFAYMRAVRPNWGWAARIENRFVPVGMALTPNRQREDLGRVLATMFPMRSRLLRFEQFLFACGCDVISLEYKMEASSLRFIDWDTHQDRRVLEQWRQNPN
ncbi:MAG: hypothetical protein JNN17_03580 [Verrucomicrobiaceae bacterium]|nr:hypothetical protein [Verrucomicrobiaceae bacterium]